MLRIDPGLVENVAKELYIRALKILPPDIKQGFDALAARETATTAQNVLGTMIRNIAILLVLGAIVAPRRPTTCSARTPAFRSTT